MSESNGSSDSRRPRLEVVSALPVPAAESPSGPPPRVTPADPVAPQECEPTGHPAGVVPLVQALGRVSARHADSDYETLSGDEGFWPLVRLLHELASETDDRAREARMRSSLPSIADLRVGQSARVIAVFGKRAVRQRILDMGLLPDEEVRVERVGLAGGPLWIRFSGTQVALRRAEAKSILVRV